MQVVVKHALAVLAIAIAACASSENPPPAAPPAAPSLPPRRHVVPEDAAVKFKGQDVFVGRRKALGQIPGVSKDDLIWAPDGNHFAYAKAIMPPRKGWRVFVKNVAGDPINEFDVYRPGAPRELEWIDDRRLAYIAPIEKRDVHMVYVIHDAETGEVVSVRRGKMFVWSPGKKKLAYVAGRTPNETVAVDGRPVWPRGSGGTMIRGEVSWSPSGRGLAFIETNKKGDGKLVVLVEVDDTGGDLSWPLPPEAMAPGLHVYWAGNSKVVIGETSMKPKFVANWERLQ